MIRDRASSSLIAILVDEPAIPGLSADDFDFIKYFLRERIPSIFLEKDFVATVLDNHRPYPDTYRPSIAWEVLASSPP